MDNEFDVIVVGAGLAGLAAAATTSRGGARTLVLEAHRPGGRARTTEREEFTLNLGAHALFCGGSGARVLADLGVVPAGTAPPLRRYMGSLDGALHRLPTDAGSLLRTSLLGIRSKVQLASFLARLPRMDPADLAGTSTRSWLDDLDLRTDGEAIALALLRLGTYCPDVDHFGADAALSQLQIAASGGVHYLHGGWSQLTDALSATIEVRPSAAVRALEPAAGRIEVRTDDGTVVARQVVVAVGPPAVARPLLPEPPGWGELGDPVTAACLDVGARRVPSPGYVLGIDVPLYATTQGPPARQAPAGHAVVGVLRYGARSAELDRPELEAYRRLCGVADEDVVFERFLASMTVAGTMPRAEAGGMRGRPAVGDTGTPGILLAGDWVGPDGLLADAALASGHAAGTRALDAVARTGRTG
ncbi:MAG TPA: FAD-dependent oxidoreductase [Acidimicrobiales bacterium]